MNFRSFLCICELWILPICLYNSHERGLFRFSFKTELAILPQSAENWQSLLGWQHFFLVPSESFSDFDWAEGMLFLSSL
jgi:hypothetical protein